ncbi:hypothetical protein DW668_05020 [Bacteroides stercoris]|uniref:DUF7666 domain-containing protein n=2 Tax=Bacteroides stercoris TaxID=46506 RepID=A0A414Q8A8_BACSE|nr:hypothetical protein DW668_05020 [Bacteroides stercoris]
MTCRGFKYEEGKDYEEQGDISACSNGFHYCLHPLDVFGYYPPAYIGMNKFHEVEGSGDMDVDTDDTKIACSKIHIGAELSIKSIVDAAIKFTFSKCKWVKEKIATGYQGAASATGDQGAASATGDYGAASATGYQGAASATGKESIALAAGKDCKAKGALGCWIVLTERGEWDENTYPIISVKAFKVDGKSIKEDTFYTLINGEAVEMK